MIRNYIKIAFRSLLRNQVVSIINISGLAIGMTAVILILLWVNNEFSYDRFHTNKDRVFQLWNKGVMNKEPVCWYITPSAATKYIRQTVPEVEKSARISSGMPGMLRYAGKSLKGEGLVVDPEFLEIFTFPLLSGNVSTVLADKSSIVITREFSQKLFGDENPVGKVVNINREDDHLVTGVLENPPANTMFSFDYLIPFSYQVSKSGEDNNLSNNSVMTMVMLKPNASFAAAQEKIMQIRKKYQQDYTGWDMFLYPLTKCRLYGRFENGVEAGGRIELVQLFVLISGFILVIACINFVNLSTARSEKRAREVGIRKTMGASRGSLIMQFLSESILLVTIAFLISMVLVELFLPDFRELIGEKLFIRYDRPYFWISAVLFILFTGLLAGVYPAFYLSSFRPAVVLKGTFRSATALITPRKILVVVQFTFAIALIVSTIVVKQQVRYVQKREAGYDKHQMVYHFLNPDLEKNFAAFKNDIISNKLAVSVTRTNAPFTQYWSDTDGGDWAGKDPNEQTIFVRMFTDEDFVKTAGARLIAGRDFNLREFPSDSSGLIINESALRIMGFKDPIGQILKEGEMEWHIIGVIKDFIITSPYEPTKPLLVEGAMGWFNVVHIRLHDGARSSDLKRLEQVFKKYCPDYPAEFVFLSEEYAQKFFKEERIGKFASLFALLAVFISCMGLYGLATYMAENRIKEIGIRKVMGASVVQITRLLAADFMKLVVVAIVIALPLSGWVMDQWLSGYPYRMNVQWWVFAVAGLLSIFIALFTVSFQSVKAAMSNPVKNLRSE